MRRRGVVVDLSRVFTVGMTAEVRKESILWISGESGIQVEEIARAQAPRADYASYI